MNVLYIVPYTPNPIRVRPYQLIRALARRGHRVTLATVWENAREKQELDEFIKNGVDVIAAPLTKQQRIYNSLRTLPTALPVQANFCRSPQLLRSVGLRLNAHAQELDIVHTEHLRGAEYGVWLLDQMQAHGLRKRIPVVWDSVDCISYLFEQAVRYNSASPIRRMIMRLELGRTRRYEGRMANRFDRVLVTSQADRQALLDLSGGTAPVSVLSNGVDLAHFFPADSLRHPDTVVFSGKMSYHANVAAALYLATQVMPVVWEKKPSVRLIIAGSQPAPAIRQLAESQPERVTVTGRIPDMRQPLQEASVSAAPLLYGAGIQNKVLEAMACATPVVASSRALAALTVQPGKDCLVADTPAAFADALLRLLNDDTLCGQIGAAGRRYVERNHDWGRIGAALDDIYCSVIRTTASS